VIFFSLTIGGLLFVGSRIEKKYGSGINMDIDNIQAVVARGGEGRVVVAS
jgi:hypothetical protein